MREKKNETYRLYIYKKETRTREKLLERNKRYTL